MIHGREPAGLPADEAASRPRSAAARRTLIACAAFFFVGFIALGTWQVQRLHWKLALIERVEQRVHAAPVPAPGPERWPQVTAESEEYRHVQIRGVFLPAASTLVQATTELGAGYWLLTPLRADDGSLVLINRGYITAEAGSRLRRALAAGHDGRHDAAPAPAPTVVTGLLRISEPGGHFPRRNEPAADRWYSRDLQAIAAARGLGRVAPYFIDADAAGKAPQPDGSSPDQPVGGLTVIAFHNSHLVYALTWYALALMTAGACWWIVREERRKRQGAAAGHAGKQETRNAETG